MKIASNAKSTLIVMLGWMAVAAGPACVPATADAQPSAPPIATLADLDQWIQHYYEQPRPDLTISAIQFVDKADLLSKKSAQPLTGFLSSIFRDNPDKLPGWGADIHALHTKTRRIVWLSLWLSGAEAARTYLAGEAAKAGEADRRYLEALTNERLPNLLKRRIAMPADVDILWGAFLASGDTEYVRRIISVLPWCTDNKDVNKLLVGEAAKWVLSTNAAQHKRVLTTCQDELKKSKGDVRALLEEVLKAAQEGEGAAGVK